jgi:hypothetical protein
MTLPTIPTHVSTHEYDPAGGGRQWTLANVQREYVR